jgi:hypothetical protein
VSFCAICTSPRGPFVREPLGRDNALVSVCSECVTEPARAETGPDRSYEPTGGLLKTEDAVAGARRAMGDERYDIAHRIEEQYSRSPSPALSAEAVLDLQHKYDNALRNRSRASQRRSTRSSRERKLY